MEERYLKFEDLMADLAAYLVSEYDIEPRDATGLVMNSPLTQELYSSEEPIIHTNSFSYICEHPIFFVTLQANDS